MTFLVSLNLLKTILRANDEDTDQMPAGPNMDPNRLQRLSTYDKRQR